VSRDYIGLSGNCVSFPEDDTLITDANKTLYASVFCKPRDHGAEKLDSLT